MRFKLMTVLIPLLSLSAHAGPAKPTKLEQEVAELRRVQESNSRILAETVQNVAAIRQELQELRGAIEEARHFVEEGARNNDRLLREFDYRLTGVEERLTLYGTQLEEFLTRAGSSPPSPPRGTPRVDNDEDSLYRRALAEINTQNYKSALSLLDQFLKKYPKSSLVDNAQYWKGEALYASKDYPNAILEFQKVIKQYSKSEKVPGAILKQGYSFYEMKNYLDAKAFLQKVVTEFPQSDEAAAAKERIFKIDRLLAKAPPPATPVKPTSLP